MAWGKDKPKYSDRAVPVNKKSPPTKPADANGCDKCAWTLLDYGWNKGDDNPDCAKHGD